METWKKKHKALGGILLVTASLSLSDEVAEQCIFLISLSMQGIHRPRATRLKIVKELRVTINMLYSIVLTETLYY